MTKFFTKAAVSLTALLAVAGANAGAQTTFNAAVSYPPQSAGMYQFTTDSYNPTQIKREVYASGGGLAYDGYYYGVRFEIIAGIPGVAEQSFSLDTWEISDNYPGSITDVATAIAYNADRDEVLGCYYNEDGASFRLCSVNVPYWSKTLLTQLPKAWAAADFAVDGTLYVIDEDGILSKFDTKTYESTPIGDTGKVTTWITGGKIDPATGAFLYSVKNDTEAALYSVDLQTAAATKLFDLENEEQLGGFYFPETAPAANVPAPVSSVGTSFSGTSLTGKVRFQMPRTLQDGTAAEGPLTYHIYANGQLISSGESTFGASGYQQIEVTVPAADTYSFAVTAENENGESKRVRASKIFVGPDTPKATTRVQVTDYKDGQVTLSWASVSNGLHGGNIDRNNLRYRVTRYPDGVVVSSDDLATYRMTDALPFPAERTEYYYTVEAVCGDLVSPATVSPTFALGPITPAESIEFTSKANTFGWTALNPGTDTKAWSFYSDHVEVETNAKPADSWFVSPAINVKAGNTYEITLNMSAYSSRYTETFELMAGTAADASSLTEAVIPATDITSTTYAPFTGSYTATADGQIYLGIHATSANGYTLRLKGVSISEGVSTLAPAAVSDLQAAAGENGAHTATLTFTLPTLNLGGNTLEEITSVELQRNGETVKTVTEGLTPGAQLSITDDVEVPAGNQTYTVVCYNTYGAGNPVSAELFIGFAAPLQVASVNMTETTVGHVVASWEPVTKDAEGNDLGEGDVWYRVSKYISGSPEVVIERVDATTCEFDVEIPEGSQQFVQTLVEAITEGGSAKIKPSVRTALGTPYAAPWSESFANCTVTSLMGYEIMEGTDAWTMVPYHSNSMADVTPVDNDGGLMFLEGYIPAKCAIVTGKIDLGDVPVPALVFYSFNFNLYEDTPNKNGLEVQVNDGTGYQTLLDSTVGQFGNPNEWGKVVVPLDDYAGRCVQVRIISTSVDLAYHYIDALQVTSNAEYNLGVTSIDAPASVDRNKPFDIKVSVGNTGLNRALGYKVNLYLDDELLDTKSGEALEPDAMTTVAFSHTFDSFAASEATLKAEIEFGPDMAIGDNTMETTVIVRDNDYPTVTDLAGVAADGKVQLSWSKPAAADAVTVAQTEAFDAASSAWTSAIDGWTFLDIDKATIGGIGSKTIPVSGRQSFFVMDSQFAAFNGSTQFASHSGTQHLCSMYVMRGSSMIQSDDWAITPELTGKPQIVTLWASSFQADPDQTQYYETFQMLYSTTGTEPEDFTLIEEVRNVAPQWKQYSAYVPEGARYFAVRSVSYDAYMLFVDDVTFKAADGATVAAEICGYNVYRDSQLISAEPVEETAFADENAQEGKTYTYAVTTVYNDGESAPSNLAIIDTTNLGINGVYGSEAVNIRAIDGSIEVLGAAGKMVTVVTPAGAVLYSAPGAARVEIPVARGLYLVTVGTTTAKLAVE